MIHFLFQRDKERSHSSAAVSLLMEMIFYRFKKQKRVGQTGSDRLDSSNSQSLFPPEELVWVSGVCL